MSKQNLVTVAGSVTPELKAALEEHRWQVRMTLSQVAAKALTEYAVNHNLVTPEAVAPDEATDAPEKTEAKPGKVTPKTS